MKILITGNYKEMFKEQYCFLNKDSQIHEGCYNRLIELYNSFAKENINLIGTETLNIKTDQFSALIIHDYPKDEEMRYLLNKIEIPIYLIAEEAPFLLPENYDKKLHEKFRKIFTWMDNLIDDNKYIRNFSLFPDIEIAKKIRFNDININDKHGIVLVASLRPIKHKDSRYALREKIAEWYSNQKEEEFHIYGRYWNRYYFFGEGLLIKILNSKYCNILFKRNQFKNLYKGILKSKYNELNKYLFQLCIENTEGCKGYITEKVFDSIICRNIPVYFPCVVNDINRIIPSNVYIDASKFATIEDLNKFLKGLSKEEIQNYFKNAENFINNIPKNLTKNFASDKLVKNIIDDLKRM